MLRFLRYLGEAIAAFVGVGIVLALLLVWRLSVSPISSELLTPYIESGIEKFVPGSKAHVENAELTWGGLERSIVVHADNLTVNDASGRSIAVLPSVDAKISILGLLFGQFMPRDLVVDHPQIKLERTKDGAFIFGGLVIGGKSDSSQTTHSFVANLIQRLTHETLMQQLSIKRVVIGVHDDGTEQDWSVSVPDIELTRKMMSANNHSFTFGVLEGNMTIEVTQKDAVATVNVEYSYDPLRQEHTMSTLFKDVTPSFFAGGNPQKIGLGMASMIDLPLTGNIKLILDKNLTVAYVDAQIHGDEGHIVYPDFWDHPCPVASFDFNAIYDRTTQSLSVSKTHVDLEGPTIDMIIDGIPSTQKGQDLDYTLQLKVDNFPMNSYSDLWPKPLLPDPRYWLATNLRDGTLTHAEISLNGAVAINDLANMSIVDGGGKVSAVNGRVTYMDGLPPVENVNATATFDLKKMAVQITSGNIGNIRLSPFTVQITGLADTDQYIDIPAQISGPVPEIMHVLNQPPLGYAKALGLSPDDISGQIDALCEFRFPLIRSLDMKDLFIHAQANATNIASTKIIPGVTVDQGNLALTLDMSGVQFTGQASLDKIPFQILWQENFEQKPGQNLRHATITGSVKDDQWNNFGINTFNGTKGSIAVTMDMTKPSKNKTVITGILDMNAAAVEVYALNWLKPVNMPTTLKFVVTANGNKPVEVSPITLRGPQIIADGNATMSPDMMRVLSLNFSPFALGRTNTNLHFAQSYGPDGAMSLEATGAALDVSGFLSDKDPGRADPRPKQFHIQVDKLYTSGNGEIDKAQGSALRDQEGWSSISLHGLADGDAPLSIELTPQPDGHRTLSITSDSFGKAMKGLGFTDTVKGGSLSISGESTVEAPRVIIGTAKINDFTVVHLPALALLLNATSPFGFTGILTDSASFSHFSGDFRWHGDDVTLTTAHAAGSAIGINIDGKVNMDSGDANLQGTLVPFSVMNNVLNYIPIIGNIITGGDNQGVLAVSYTIKGSLNAPKVSVNPISLLTPGFIRNLFFRDDTAEDSP